MWLSSLLLGCGPPPTPVLDPGEPCEQTADFDGTVSYDPERLLCVQITMNADELTEMSHQQRWGGSDRDLLNGVVSQVITSCTEPFPDPYTWFSADVTVQGETITDVGIRKKGFVGSAQSRSKVRPSIKIDTDRFVDQLLGDTERLTLNNNLTDRSRLHTCLSYSVFTDAGYPAPRCNLANVMVNGTSLGAYTHVEAIKKRFLRRTFGNDDGSLYESTVADFGAGYLEDGLGRWEAKTSDTDLEGVPLQRVAAALEVPDEQLEAALEQVLDLDAFFTFWALETLTAHQDGHNGNTNNTYVYFDPDDGDRAVLIPWGTDDAMRAARVRYDSSLLPYRLSRHPELYARYLDRLQQVLDDVWDEQALVDRIATWEAQVETVEGSADTDPLVSFVLDRRDQVQAFIDQGGNPADERDLACTGPLAAPEIVGLAEVTNTFAVGCATSRPTTVWSTFLRR